jgi:hypothetical protein
LFLFVALFARLSRVIECDGKQLSEPIILKCPKERTMKNITKVFALASLLVLFTFSSALAQSDRQTIIYIPFNFSVGEKSFNAGKYIIERNRKDSDTVWVIKRKDNVGSALMLTQSVRANEPAEATRLVFNRYGDQYFLSEFWTPGSNTGREVQISDREKALDKALATTRTEHVLIDRGK